MARSAPPVMAPPAKAALARAGAVPPRDAHGKRADTVIAEGVAGTAMIAWSQAQGGILDDDAIDDLLALLLQWRRAMPATQASATVESAPVATLATLSSAPWVAPFSLITLLAVVLTLLLTASAFWQD